MKRLCFLAVLLTLSSSAHAGRSFSFNLGKHRVHVESARHCHSLKCAAVSISKRLHWRQRRDRYEDERDATMPARPVPAVPQTVSPPAPPPSAPPKAIVDATPAPVYTAAASRTYPADPPPLAPQVQDVSIPAPPTPSVAKPVETAPQLERVLHKVEEETPASDSPIGDWQTEGKGGLVRIEACGEALCGYVLNASTRAKGETVLVNMKAKNVTQWTGNIYSRSSGTSYFGTMTLKEVNTLRVEACAVGKFFCSGNNWTRLEDGRSIGSNEMATSRRHVAGARF